MNKDVSLDEQIEEVMREIYMRERMYPQWVQARRMTGTRADQQLARMRAVLETLREVKQLKERA